MSGLVITTTGLQWGQSLQWMTPIGADSLVIDEEDQSQAETMLDGESQGVALAFTDDYFEPTTGQYGSAYIRDTTTPANNFNSIPYSLLTYTSPSAKMVMGPSGLLRFVAHNLCLQSEDLTQTGQWSTQSGTPVRTAGTIEDDDSIGYEAVEQTITGVITGATYTLTFRVTKDAVTTRFPEFRLTSGSNSVFFRVDTQTGAGHTVSSTNGSGSVSDGGTFWSVTLDIVAGTTTAVIRIYPAITQTLTGTNTTAAVGAVSATAFHFRRTPSDPTYLATTTTARYALPIEFDLSGTEIGLLPEAAATNLLTYSQQFDNAEWTELGVAAVSAGSTVAPDGTATAETITADAGTRTTGTLLYPSERTLSSGTTYALSFFVKKNTHRYAAVNLQSSTANQYVCAVFDLDGGGSTATETSVGSSSGTLVSTSQVSVGDGWFRLAVVGNVASASFFPWVGLAAAATGNSFNSNGQVGGTWAGTESVYIWGAQLEAGSSPSSYIPTIASTVTRAADNISLATSAFPFNLSDGTIYFECTRTASSGNRWILSMVTTGSGLFDLVAGDGNVNFRHGDTTNQDASISGQFTSGKIGGVYTNGGNHGVSVNGSAITNSAGNSAALSGATLLRLGIDAGAGSTSILNSNISRILYLPRRMSNAELITLTTP